MATLRVLFFWRGVHHQRHSTFRQRNDGSTLPESIRDAFRRRAVLIDCQRVVGGFNIAMGYLLIVQVGNFDLRDPVGAAVVGVGALLMAVLSARLFGRFHGGNSPEK